MKTECFICSNECEWEHEYELPICQECEEEKREEEKFMYQEELEREKVRLEEEQINRYSIYEDLCLSKYT